MHNNALINESSPYLLQHAHNPVDWWPWGPDALAEAKRTNLPILLAGGGFKHAGHVAFDRKNNTLLSNLYVRILHQLGIEAKTFGASTGVVSEI